MNVVEDTCKSQHDARAHEHERDVDPSHGNDLSIGGSQNSSCTSWRVNSVGRCHDRRRYGTCDSACDPLDIFPVRVEVEELVNDYSCER